MKGIIFNYHFVSVSLVVTFFASSFLSGCDKAEDPQPGMPAQLTVPCVLESSFTNGIQNFHVVYGSDFIADTVVFPFAKISYNISSNRFIGFDVYTAGTKSAYMKIHYDANGLRTVDSTFLTSGLTTIAQLVYNYTYTGTQITRVDIYELINSGSSYLTLTYDANGNITMISDYDPSDNLVQTTEYTYDDKNYSSIGGLSTPYEVIQKHNRLTTIVKTNGTAIDASKSFSSTFTYNSNYYPLTDTQTYQNATVVNKTYTYNCQ